MRRLFKKIRSTNLWNNQPKDRKKLLKLTESEIYSETLHRYQRDLEDYKGIF